jgi:hypothetical protein
MWHSSSSHGHAVAADHILLTQALRSRHASAGIEASLRAWLPSLAVEPSVLVLWLNQVTRRFSGEPPQTPHADFGHEPLPYNGSDRRLCLAFLATMRPALNPADHRVPRVRPICLSTPRSPTRHRPLKPTLHLHQRNSSRNLHLQYSAKSQSTPHCQTLITARSDHPPVLGRSGPQALSLPPNPFGSTG